MDVLTWVVEQHQADVSVPNSSGLSVYLTLSDHHEASAV